MFYKLFYPVILFMISSGSTQAQQRHGGVINTHGFNYYANISPTGHDIVFVKMYEEDYWIYGDLWLYDAQADSTRQLTRNTYHAKSEDNSISWSPDGSKIYFSAGGSILEYNLLDNSVKMLVKTDIENENRTVFAPTISNDGKKIAYWEMNYGDNTHGISYLDLETGEVSHLHRVLFNPGTDVMFYNPQWSEDDRRLFATYFKPEDRIQLLSIDLASNEASILDERLLSTYFVVKNQEIYYTKLDWGTKERVLHRYSFNQKKQEILKGSQAAVFDVADNRAIYFSRNDSVYAYSESENDIRFIIQGSNPVVRGNKMIVEQWTDIDDLETRLVKVLLSTKGSSERN